MSIIDLTTPLQISSHRRHDNFAVGKYGMTLLLFNVSLNRAGYAVCFN